MTRGLRRLSESVTTAGIRVHEQTPILRNPRQSRRRDGVYSNAEALPCSPVIISDL